MGLRVQVEGMASRQPQGTERESKSQRGRDGEREREREGETEREMEGEGGIERGARAVALRHRSAALPGRAMGAGERVP